MVAHDRERPLAASRQRVRRVGERIEVHRAGHGRAQREPHTGRRERGEDVREPNGDPGGQGPDARADERERRRAARHVGLVEDDQPAHREPGQERDGAGCSPNGPHR